MIECDAAGNLFQIPSILLDRMKQPGNRRFAFSGQHTIYSASGVLQNFLWNK